MRCYENEIIYNSTTNNHFIKIIKLSCRRLILRNKFPIVHIKGAGGLRPHRWKASRRDPREGPCKDNTKMLLHSIERVGLSVMIPGGEPCIPNYSLIRFTHKCITTLI